jgi:uncharacterized protein (DUF1501 family)
VLGHSAIGQTAWGEIPRAQAPVAAGVVQTAGGAFTRRPDRRLSLRDLQEYFTSEQEALQRAEKAKGKREREALEEAAAAVSAVMRAAVGVDEACEPDLADVSAKLRAAANAERASKRIRLAQEARDEARALEPVIRAAIAGAAEMERRFQLERARYEAELEDEEQSLFLLGL